MDFSLILQAVSATEEMENYGGDSDEPNGDAMLNHTVRETLLLLIHS